MTPRCHRLVLLAVPTTILLFSGWMGWSQAQDVPLPSEPRVDDRASNRLEGVLEVEPILEGNQDLYTDGFEPGNLDLDDPIQVSGWDLGVVASAAYESNIFLSAEDEESDLVLRLTPRIAYEMGDRDGNAGAHIRFAYRPTGVVYLGNEDVNRIDQEAILEAGVKGEKISWLIAGVARELGDATADAGQQVDRFEYELEIRVAWAPREKLAVEVAAGTRGARYEGGFFTSTKDRFGELATRWAYSPKTQLGLAYRVGRSEVEGTGDQTFQRVVARVAWQPRSKFSIDLEAGVEHRDFDLGSDAYPVVELRLDWEAREGSRFYLTGYRREEVSAFFSGENISVTGATAGFAQRFSEAWSGRLEGGFEVADYSRVSGIGPAGRKDHIVFIRPALEFEVNERFRAGAFYEFSANDSNDDAFGFDNHQIGVTAAYDF